jgi:hypothetical protein
MLRVTIQTSILVFLIILIVHFFIRNVLVERFPKGAPLAIDTKPQISVQDNAATDDLAKKAPKEAKDSETIELFEWAYPDNKPTAACDSHLDIEDLYKKNTRSGHAPQEQPLKKVQVLSEYQNENVMNGGALFANLHGYDQAEANWSSINGSSVLPPYHPASLKPCGQNTVSPITGSTFPNHRM